MKITRRGFIQTAGAATAVGMVGVPYIALGATKKVVVVGGGTGGATAARYIKMADPGVEVTLIEANPNYYTCYLSNEVLSGDRELDSIKFGYDGLGKEGIKVVNDTVMLSPHRVGVGLSEDGADASGHDRLIGFGNMSQHVVSEQEIRFSILMRNVDRSVFAKES